MKTQTICELGLTYKTKKDLNEVPTITSPDKAEKYLRSIFDKNTIELREEFIIVLLNNAKKVLGWSRISIGGVNATIVDPCAVFRVAILTNSSSILLCHNHPSSRIAFSETDIRLTKRLIEIGKLFSIDVADHIILTKDSYSSYMSKGI